MKDNFNPSTEHASLNAGHSDAHSAESAHAKVWSDLSASLWSGNDLLPPPRDGHGGGPATSGANDAPVKADITIGTSGSALPPLEISDFKSKALQVFDRLDTNHQGFVSKEQMAVAIGNDPSIKGNDAEALAAIYGVIKGEYSGHVPADINPTVMTRAQIEDMPDSLAQQKFNFDNLKTISDSDLVTNFDPNNSGRISESAVTSGLGPKAGAAYGQMAQDYAAKYLTLAEQAQVSQNGLTPDELKGLVKEQGFRTREAEAINMALKHAEGSLANAQNPETFTNAQNPVESVKQADVQQGRTGDCYFDAALAAVAATQPEAIANAIKENSNGSYTVTFKGDPEHPMTVPAPTDAELALYNSASPDGIWPNIMEKAFADHQILFGHRVIDNDTPQDAISGGRAGVALALLTGEQTHDQSVAAGNGFATGFNEQGRINSPVDQLAIAARDGYDAVVGIGNPSEGSGLARNHDYTVVGFQPGAAGGTFELRNPWDDAAKTNGDYFSISGDQLAQSMDEVAYAPGS